MFQITADEHRILISQIEISNSGHGGRRKPPLVFTEQGVAMLSSVLNSQRAIQVNIAIMRAFVRLREILSTNKKLADKIFAMERKYDDQFKVVFEAIRQLLHTPEKKMRKIGFKV